MILFAVLLSSCCRTDDSLIGRWTVERVNVEFDETRSTPEMVRQYGELEKGNVIEISKDSLLTFVSNGDTLTGSCSLKGTQLTCDGKPFGLYVKGIIQTETDTPLGKIVVVYHRK